ncbi:response regulator [Bremerella sp. JC817]|uniref:response regulator n=1 Tax=Bremerella sp. JC817 TaxID=3231756 RepID=UPI0034590337
MNHEVLISDTSTLNLLLLEDDDVDYEAIERHLTKSEFPIEICRAETLEMARKHLARKRFDIVLADLCLPDSQGLETVSRLAETCKQMAIMAITGIDDPDLEQEVMKRGAHSYFLKQDNTGGALARAIYSSVRHERFRRQHNSLLEQMHSQQKSLEEFSRQLKEENELLRNIHSLRHQEETVDYHHLSNHLSKDAVSMLAVEAEQASRAKSEFLLTICHELRTSMEGILSIHDHLLRTPLTDQQKACVDASLANNAMLMRLVREASEIAKIESGRAKLQPFVCDMSAIIAEVAATAAPLLQQKNVNLTWHCDSQFSDSVFCDGQQIRQMLILLLSNAIKFTTQGQIEIRGTTISSGRSVGRMRISIADSGVGITPDVLDALRKAFAQGNLSAMPPLQNPSLGLSLCLQIARLVGGEIGVESERWKGSRFWINFPVEFPEKESHFCVSPPHQEITRRPNFLKIADGNGSAAKRKIAGHVLVAHDSRVLQLYLVEQLRQLGYSADTAKDGSNVMYLLGRKKYDLILVDCHLPVHDAFGIANRIRSAPQSQFNGSRPRIVAISDRFKVHDLENHGMESIDGFLTIPTDLARLRETLDSRLMQSSN